MADIKQIEVSGTKYNISGAAIVLEKNGSIVSKVLKLKTNQISSLIDGQLFLYKLTGYDHFPSIFTKIQITGSSGTSLGDKNFDSTIECKSYGYICFTYSSDIDAFLLVNSFPDGNALYKITKIYGGSSYPSYPVLILSDYGLNINNPNTNNYIAGIKDDNWYINGPNGGICHGTKVWSMNNKSVRLEAYGNNKVHLELDPHENLTKIILSDSQTAYSYSPQFKFVSNDSFDGLYINRPIYLGSPNEDASDSSSSMSYNADEDCIEFKFE